MADIEKLDLSMAGERCDDAVLPCPAQIQLLYVSHLFLHLAFDSIRR